MDSQAPVLEVQGLCTAVGKTPIVRDVGFRVRPGEVLGIVGESGSGKSMTANAIMGLLDPPAGITSGSVKLLGRELTGLGEDGLRNIRGNQMSMIFQDPMMTLNPVLTIGTQLTEAVLAHRKVSRKEAWRLGVEALEKVGIPSAPERMRAHPHQLSGGMRQRVAIAIGIINKPHLIIADEPTTALDVTVQGQILFEVQKLVAEQSTAVVWITHDLSVVSGLADSILVMYCGAIVESGPASQVLSSPQHPYTVGLLNAIPRLDRRGERLTPIKGNVPSPAELDDGCAFRLRCPRATEICQAMPKPRAVSASRRVACHHVAQQPEFREAS